MMKDNAYRKIFERFGRLNRFRYCYVVKIIDVSSNRDSAISFASTTMKVYSPHNLRRCERNNNDRNSARRGRTRSLLLQDQDRLG